MPTWVQFYQQTFLDSAPDVWDAFLQGYEERRPLRDVERAAIPVVHAAGMVYGLGLKTRGVLATWWDSWWLAFDFFDQPLAFLRTWDQDHLR